MAAWVKGEVSCCSLISGRDCESPAEPVQPEEALLCRTDTGSHAQTQEPVGMVGGTTARIIACGEFFNRPPFALASHAARRSNKQRQRQAAGRLS